MSKLILPNQVELAPARCKAHPHNFLLVVYVQQDPLAFRVVCPICSSLVLEISAKGNTLPGGEDLRPS